MRPLYAARRLLAQPMTDEICIAIGAVATAVVAVVEILWGLPQ